MKVAYKDIYFCMSDGISKLINRTLLDMLKVLNSIIDIYFAIYAFNKVRLKFYE